MLCYVMLCYVMLCYVMLCYVMLCYVKLSYVMLCYVRLCYVMLRYVWMHVHIYVSWNFSWFQRQICSKNCSILKNKTIIFIIWNVQMLIVHWFCCYCMEFSVTNCWLLPKWELCASESASCSLVLDRSLLLNNNKQHRYVHFLYDFLYNVNCWSKSRVILLLV